MLQSSARPRPSRAGAMRVLVALASFGAASASADDKVLVGQTWLTASPIDPTVGSAGWALTSHGIAENLFTVNKAGEIVGHVAQSASRVSDLVWDVDLKADKKFSDGTPVTAQAVADALNELAEVNPNAVGTVGKMTVTAPCEGTVRIESTISTHVMKSVLAEWPYVIYKKDGSNFLFTGPYKVDTFVDGQLDLVPNTYYPDASLRHPIEIKQYASGDALAAAAIAGELDIGFHLPVQDASGNNGLQPVRDAAGVTVKSFEIGYHSMVIYNMDSGKATNDLKVRQAIDKAIDRDSLQQTLLGGHATRSFFPDYSPWFQSDAATGGITGGDAAGAGTLLDEAGWTLDSTTGKRTKDGADLTLKIITYNSRPGLGIMMPVIATTLEALGITVEQVLNDWDGTSALIDARDFDLLMYMQNTLPAGDPASFLNGFFKTGGWGNMAGLASTDVDAKLDALSDAETHADRVAATATAHAAVLAEQPVSNLMTPDWHVAVSDRMVAEGYEPWGSDYYIIRADISVGESTAAAPVAHRGCLSTDGAGATRAFVAGAAALLAAVFLH